jgi:type 1 glutamine amidotransferase
LFLLLLAWLAVAALPALEIQGAEPGGKTKVLIVDGYSNHDWRQTSRLLRSILEGTGLFQVSVSTIPANTNDAAYATWSPGFESYAVVIQTCNDINRAGPGWPESAKVSFETFVSEGGGVFIFHSANNAFRGWEAYNRIIGLGWRARDYGWAIRVREDETLERIPPGQGSGTGHGARTDRVIHRIGNHPIHAGVPRRWMTPSIEVYTHARGPAENVTVLSWAEDPATKGRWPTEWSVQFGRGRVYCSSFGHVWSDEPEPVNMRCAGFQTLLVRAVQWLAGEPVTYPLPIDFPTEAKTSLRDLERLSR